MRCKSTGWEDRAKLWHGEYEWVCRQLKARTAATESEGQRCKLSLKRTPSALSFEGLRAL
jgi:hypothetical protein